MANPVDRSLPFALNLFPGAGARSRPGLLRGGRVQGGRRVGPRRFIIRRWVSNSLRRCYCDFTQHAKNSLAIYGIGVQTPWAWMRTVEHLNIRKLSRDYLASVLVPMRINNPDCSRLTLSNIATCAIALSTHTNTHLTSSARRLTTI
jgi:hypothetical protein